jgi:hypothetical protein
MARNQSLAFRSASDDGTVKVAKLLLRSFNLFCAWLSVGLVILSPAGASSQVEGVDLAADLKSQIAPCWSPPTEASDISELVVDLHVLLNKDGSVASVQMLDETRAAASRNAHTRASVQAAMRALYKCQPYRLPPERYNLWREISPLRFDPRQMMEQ